MLENIPNYGPEFVEELRRIGADFKKEAEKELAEFYPKDPDGVVPFAYLWARTVKCESPNCGAEIPLARSFWLCTKTERKRALRYTVVRPDEEPARVQFEIFHPRTDEEVPSGTISNGRATCCCCEMVLPPQRVRAQLAERHGRADVVFDTNGNRIGGTRLLAAVTRRPGETAREYRLSTERDYQAVWKAQKQLEAIISDWEQSGKPSLCPAPDELINPLRPSANARGLSAVTRYGAERFSDLFTARQSVLLITLTKLIAKKHKMPALVLGKIIRHSNAFTFWHKASETVAGAFGRHALPMSWDFPEFYPFVGFAGGLDDAVDDLINAVSHIVRAAPHRGQSAMADAGQHPLPSDSATIWFTDPPYYDAIPYADLSDFFFVWLTRALPSNEVLRDPFDLQNPLTPKAREIVQSQKDKATSGRAKDKAYYEEAMAKAFSEGRRILREDGIGSIVFAHKTTEGWEALLSGMMRGGWTVTGSWPIATERGARLLARETAALATSVHLVCRPRPDEAPIGDWGQVHRELPRRVAEWMNRLQDEHIRGADLVFACIGPALEIYSRYSKVVDAEDREIPLGGDPEATEPHKRGYLAYVWEAVGRAALEQVLGTAEAAARNGAAGALEEDARLTALFLWTLQSTNGEQAVGNKQQATEEDDESEEEEETTSSKGKKKKGLTLVFDVVRRFAQPLGIHLDNWEDRIIETEKGMVRLLPVGERGAQLFGQDGADLVAEQLERQPASTFQLTLFPDKTEATPKVKGKKAKGKKGTDKDLKTNQEATTLDRVHAAMLLQASGRTNALRALLQAEQDRGPDFLRLANALSALYPKQSEEKRLLDAMLLAVPK